MKRKKNVSVRNRWIIAVVLVIIIKLFSLNKEWVENLYSTGAYVYISRFFRILFGWIPFSFGDILYLAVLCWLIYKLFKKCRLLFQRKITRQLFFASVSKNIFGFIVIYIVFNLFWGLNYNRKGIANQMQLGSLTYDTTDVIALQNELLEKVNATRQVILKNNMPAPTHSEIFLRAEKCYHETEKKLPFLKYQSRSVKSSMYGWWGNYLGFTGYYNPFTGEAQVNTTVPFFLQPDISLHEMGHQLGYAKEDAASFVGFLASIHSTDTLFHYSSYLNLYMYASREVFSFDSTRSKLSMNLLLPAVKKDIEEWKAFNLSHKSFIEPAITWLYSKYLKVNEQPKGMKSYNMVIAMVIAYYKKIGVI